MKQRSPMAIAIDEYVGSRVRTRRKLLGMNQKQLGAKLGVVYQQVHKYETGFNCISATWLHRLTKVLGVSISYFFEGIPEEICENLQPLNQALQNNSKQDIMLKHEAMELMEDYNRVEDFTIRNGFLEMFRALANESQGK
jgi:transcriptional regulator with XRE-family HTH domain